MQAVGGNVAFLRVRHALCKGKPIAIAVDIRAEIFGLAGETFVNASAEVNDNQESPGRWVQVKVSIPNIIAHLISPWPS